MAKPTERYDTRLKVGSEHCTQCAEGLRWWSIKVVKRAGGHPFGVDMAQNRPLDFAGACSRCRDGFCDAHASHGRCPNCGEELTIKLPVDIANAPEECRKSVLQRLWRYLVIRCACSKLRSRRQSVRDSAMLKLRVTLAGSASVPGCVLSALTHASPEVRVAAWRIMGAAADPRAMEAFKTLLKKEREIKDGWLEVEEAAALALGEIGSPQAVDTLFRTFEGPILYRDEKRAITKAIGLSGDPRATEMLTQASERGLAGAIEALGSIATLAAVEVMAEKFRSSAGYGVLEPAEGLAQCKHPRAFDVLVEALRNERRFQRSTAALALGKRGDPRAALELGAYLKDKEIRREAASALWKLTGQLGFRGRLDLLVSQQKSAEEPHMKTKDWQRHHSEVLQSLGKLQDSWEQKAYKAGSERCRKCRNCQEWLTLYRTRTEQAEAQFLMKVRPFDIMGQCEFCLDTYCREHAPDQKCPICGCAVHSP
ncbi:HEAT repeat domain-containing protein [Candidatus Hydrogenedentota bacterium]